jgi:hypothetical protein
MKRLLAIALLAACGGGPSISGIEESVQIIDSNCQAAPDMEVTVDITYQTAMNVGQTFEASIQIFGDLMQSKLDTFSCNSWTPLGAGQSARGCQRTLEDQPESQAITHTQVARFGSLPQQIQVMVVGDVLDSPGGLSVTQDFESIDCFFEPPPP